MAWEQKVKDIQDHADTMASVLTMLQRFSPEEAVIILSGALGKTLCHCEGRGKQSAIMWAGVAMDAALDIVHREFTGQRK